MDEMDKLNRAVNDLRRNMEAVLHRLLVLEEKPKATGEGYTLSDHIENHRIELVALNALVEGWDKAMQSVLQRLLVLEKVAFLRDNKVIPENTSPFQEFRIKGTDGYESYAIDSQTIGVRPKWMPVKDGGFEEGQRVLVVKLFRTGLQKLLWTGSSDNLVYACTVKEGKFQLDFSGNFINATHWTPSPSLPE